MGRLAVVGVALLLCFGVGLGACAAVVAAPTGVGGATASSGATASTTASAVVGRLTATPPETDAVPPAWQSVERAAAATCRGLDWAVLGAIGRVESDSGRSTLPGVTSGANADGAEVIYGWDRGLRHVRNGALRARAFQVSARCEARGRRRGGHSPSLWSPAHDDLLSGVACSVSF